jgi:EAL domain-containing protein (putative c-di-GMP-specific phosphodiesterase class I)
MPDHSNAPSTFDHEGLTDLFRASAAELAEGQRSIFLANYFGALTSGDAITAKQLEDQFSLNTVADGDDNPNLGAFFSLYLYFLSCLCNQPDPAGADARDQIMGWQGDALARFQRLLLTSSCSSSVDRDTARLRSIRLQEFCSQADHQLRLGIQIARVVIDTEDQFGPGKRLQIDERLLATLRSHHDGPIAAIDEGAIVAMVCDTSRATHARVVAHHLVDALVQFIASHGRFVLARPKVGIALSADLRSPASDLLHCAQVATAHAYAKGGVSVYSPDMDSSERAAHRLAPLLKQALARGELEIFFQPQVTAAEKHLVGLEALLRWRNTPFGAISPLDVIAVAESSGMMVELRHWLIQATFREYASLHSKGIDANLSINLRPGDIVGRGIVDELLIASDFWQVAPKNVIIEITEGTVIPDVDEAVANLLMLKNHGFRVSMDDFGTAYASLTYLRLLPLDELKIDQRFVRTMLEQPDDERIVITAIELGHRFGLTVIAEGVETLETASRLQELGCDVLQGYCFAKPMSVTDLLAWSASR